MYTGNISGDPIGQYFLEPEQFNKLRVFIDGVKNLGLQPVALSTISDNSYQIHDKNSGVIIVSLEDTEKTLSNLESIISDTTLGVLKDGNLQVRSLDLRYGNKIILKKE